MKKDKRSGSALVLAALFLLGLIPMVGLAIDGTNVYFVRNQIQTALNAAVLAGNRSLSLGSSPSEQNTALNTVANMTFSANISGLNLPGLTPSFNVTYPNQLITVTGSVSASVPLMLMKLIGLTTTPDFTVTATSSRRSVNVMLVLDHSSPMAGTPLAEMQADAITFVNMFVNGTDNIGLVTFTAAPYVADHLPNQNFQSNVPNDIGSINAPNNTFTNASAAMSAAYQELYNLNQPGALNVIVLFTEELAGAFTGNFAGLVTSGATACNPAASPLNGVLFSNLNPGSRILSKIGGLADPTSLSVTDTPDTRAAPGCTGPQPSNAPASFLSAMPTRDVYGNSTNGRGSISEYPNAPVILTMIDGTNITYAGENALDDAANLIRGSATLPAAIFAIGLGGIAGATPPDSVLMPRVANDPSSTYYNSSQPAGQYIYAPTTGQLQAAFKSIASQVLKLAQ